MFYIATNGASCALSCLDFARPPEVIPRPRCLIGFPTLAEAVEAQKICLNAPVAEIAERMRGWAHEPQLNYPRNDNPDPPTKGQTLWMASAVQDAAELKATRDKLAEG